MKKSAYALCTLTLVLGIFIGRAMSTGQAKSLLATEDEMTIDGTLKDGKPFGDALIKVFKLGQDEPFSTSSSDGEMKYFNGLGGDSQAILINIQGDNGVAQLYASKKINLVAGNYYSKEMN